MPAHLDLFAACSPGLEPVVADELVELGGSSTRVVPGGVELRGDWPAVAHLNLWSRCADRILVRIGTFGAKHLSELRRQTARLDWGGLLDAGQPVRVKVTCRASRIYHSGAARQRVEQGIADAIGRQPKQAAEEGADVLTLAVRIHKDKVTVSADSSGEHLHRRGYKLRTAKAPLRETLAAAFLRLCGWPAQGALHDPMCGSGTLPIEAAMMAAGIAPGAKRRFACQAWPEVGAELFSIPGGDLSASMVLGASDRNAGAIEATIENAERAGVADLIDAQCGALSAVTAVAEHGLLITNPPYGGRIGRGRDLRNLYARLGQLARGPFANWRVALVTSHITLARHTGVPVKSLCAPVDHGGTKIKLYDLIR